MTKADLVENICEKSAFFMRQEVAEYLEQVIEIMKETLERGETIKVSGFGNFIVREKRPRKGRNPQTTREIIIMGRRVLKFKPSQKLRKLLNQGGKFSETREL